MELKSFVVFAIVLLLALVEAALIEQAAVPNRVQGEYLVGEAYLVKYKADENGFWAHVDLAVSGGNPSTIPPGPRIPPMPKADIVPYRIAIKPQDGDKIGCALRNSLCGK